MTTHDDRRQVDLRFSKKAISVLSMIPPKEKDSPKRLRRVSRIRRNLLRELDALNRELRRHRPLITVL